MFLKTVAAFACVLLSVTVTAQTPEQKNELKLNLSSFALKGFTVQYERQVSQKWTVAFAYGMVPFSSLPYKSYIKTQIFVPDIDIAEYKLGAYIFTPEARYYFGKKGAFHGFYLAPYARIGSYKIDGPVIFYTEGNTKQYTTFSGNLTAITGGVMAGSSWQLSDKFYLDVWIGGASFGWENGKFTSAATFSEADQVALTKKLNSISLLGVKLTSTVDGNGAVVKSSGSMVGFRGLGINFGIRF